MPKAQSEPRPARARTVLPRKKRTANTNDSGSSSRPAPAPRRRPPAPSLPSKPIHPSAVLFRTLCVESVRIKHPNIEVRNDFDLIELAGPGYEGTAAEIYAKLDEMLAYDVAQRGYERVMEVCTKGLDTYVEPTGIKPEGPVHDDKYIFVRPIPDSEYSFRLFPGSISAAEYCLDFVETATGNPVNSPFEYELWGVPNPDADTPWLSIPMVGKLKSIERIHGIKQEKIDPGEEKFILRDGQTCMLVRPGKRSLRFTVPVRKVKQPESVADDVDVVDLPRYIIEP